MYRILYLVSTLGKSGPTNQLYNIVKNLDNEKFSPFILTLSPEPKESYIKRFRELNLPIESLNLSRIQGVLKGKALLKRMINEISPDIIHTQGLRADEMASKYLKEYKCIATLRNYPYEDYLMKFGKVKGSLMAIKHLRAINKLPKVVACSQSLAYLFEERKQIKMNYIQNGVNQDNYYYCNSSKKEIRENLGLKGDVTYFVTVGSLILRKDPLTIMEAFNGSDDYLLVLGDGPLIDECKKNVKRKNVIFVGNTDKVNEYLNAADYFISASLSEGLPNTVLEALATGLPVVLSDIPQHSEILKYNSNAGLAFEPKNVKHLMKQLKNIKSSEYETSSQHAKSIVDNHLNSRNMSKKYQQLYLEMVGQDE